MAVGTTRAKLRLGRYVKPIRLRSQLSAEVVAERATCSAQAIYRLEAGESLPSRARLAAILAVIGATDEERRTAMTMSDVARLPASPVQHFQDLPATYRRFRSDEDDATLERSLDMLSIPGMLQTTAYATAMNILAQHVIRTDRWEAIAGAERRERQGLLTRQKRPLSLHALVGEPALRNMVGGVEVMREQLDHLLRAGSEPNITIQIIPFGVGINPILGALFLLDFADEDEQTAVYVESVLGTQAVKEDADANSLIGVWDAVASAAASPERSAEIIREERDRID